MNKLFISIALLLMTSYSCAQEVPEKKYHLELSEVPDSENGPTDSDEEEPSTCSNDCCAWFLRTFCFPSATKKELDEKIVKIHQCCPNLGGSNQ